jgi:hypothetical protein
MCCRHPSKVELTGRRMSKLPVLYAAIECDHVNETTHPTPTMSNVRRLLSMSSGRTLGCTCLGRRGPSGSPLSGSSSSCCCCCWWWWIAGCGRRRVVVLMSRTSSVEARGGLAPPQRWRLRGGFDGTSDTVQVCDAVWSTFPEPHQVGILLTGGAAATPPAPPRCPTAPC